MSDEPGPVYRILQLSDLHFGSRCHYRSHTPAPHTTCADYIEAALEPFRSRSTPDAPLFDLIVLSGDLTSFNEDAGYSLAGQFVSCIRERWWAPRDFLLIPGNHDIGFGKKPPDGSPWPRIVIPQRKEAREQPYRRAYEQMNGQRPLSTPWLGLAKIDRLRRIAVLGLDSCRIEGWQNPGLGFVGYDQLLGLVESVVTEETPGDGGWRILAFTHHHLLLMGTPNPATARNLQWDRRFTLTADAESVLDALDEFSIDFVAHGHFHRPKIFESHNRGRDWGRVFSAGSAAVTAGDCDSLHHFYVFELFEEPTPRLTVCDVRRVIAPGRDSPWQFTDHRPFNLSPRTPRRDGLAGRRNQHISQAEEAEAFLLAYDSWPLAAAFLTDHRIPTPEEHIELFDRLQVAWERVRTFYPHEPHMEDLMPYVFPYLQRFRPQLHKEFGERLDSIDDAIPFEGFLIEKIMEDPRFRNP